MEVGRRSRSDLIRKFARESRQAQEEFFEQCAGRIVAAADVMVHCVRSGGKILFFGNGGSAADAQHLAAELTGRYLRNRPPIAAIALTTDTSCLTAVSNDFGFDRVFERQVQALGRPGDVAVGISTSGTSPNILLGMTAARNLSLITIGITGRDGGRMAEVSDHLFVVRHDSTPVIQQIHITMGHLLCDLIEEALFSDPPPPDPVSEK